MLTDVAIKALKSKEKDYKVADRDGMYVHVTTKGALSFRMDYRLNGRRETIYLGKYGPEGLSLAPAFLHMARSARERAWPLGNFAISALKPNNTAAAKGAQILLFMFSVPSRDDSPPTYSNCSWTSVSDQGKR